MTLALCGDDRLDLEKYGIDPWYVSSELGILLREVFELQDPTRAPHGGTNSWQVTTCKADDDLFPPGLAPEEED